MDKHIIQHGHRTRSKHLTGQHWNQLSYSAVSESINKQKLIVETKMAENGAYAFRVNQPPANTKCQCKLPAAVFEPSSQAQRALSGSAQPFADN